MMDFAAGLVAAALLVSPAGDPASGDPTRPGPVPEKLRDEWRLAPFYAKHMDVSGLPVLASARVHDHALVEAADLIRRMLHERPDVAAAMVQTRTRFVVMAYDERTTEVPEHSDLTPGRFWDRRARGLGATDVRPAVSCGEENLLEFPGDPYAAESILVHEFAHAIHEMGLRRVDPDFQARLEAAYIAAMEAGLWENKYAATNPAEYWAEGVQSYFDTNRENDHDHNHVDTREELEAYDPRLFELIQQEFRLHEWRYVKPSQREERGHLQGYDPAGAPTFAWEPELEKWYREYQEKQNKERRKGDPPEASSGSRP